MDRKEEILKEIRDLDMKEEGGLLLVEENIKRAGLWVDFEVVVKREEISWRQKAKINMRDGGEKCTKFFHQMARARSRVNCLEGLPSRGRR